MTEKLTTTEQLMNAKIVNHKEDTREITTKLVKFDKSAFWLVNAVVHRDFYHLTPVIKTCQEGGEQDKYFFVRVWYKWKMTEQQKQDLIWIETL